MDSKPIRKHIFIWSNIVFGITLLTRAGSSTDRDLNASCIYRYVPVTFTMFPTEPLILIYDNQTEQLALNVVKTSSEEMMKLYLYINIDSLSTEGFRNYVSQLARTYPGRHLHFHVFLDGEKQHFILYQVTYLDEHSTKSTNVRHFSTWIIYHRLHQHELNQLENIVQKFDNVAIIQPLQSENINSTVSICDVLTLIIKPDGAVFTPVPTTNTSDGNMLFPNLAFGYNRRHMTLITKAWPSFLIEENRNGTLVYTGCIHDIIDSMALALNFTYTTYNDKESGWGMFSNGTPIGTLLKMKEGLFDIFGVPNSMQRERASVIDFVLPAYRDDPIQIVYALTKSSGTSLFVYAKPFQTTVLIVILITFVTFCGLVWMRYNVLVKYKGSGRGNSFSTKSMIFQVMGTLLQQGIDIHTDAIRNRTLLASMWFFCFLLGSVYRANLVAFFSYSEPVGVFTSLEEILSSDYKIGAFNSTFTLQTLASHSSHRRLEEKIKADKMYHTNNSLHLKNMLAGKYMYISDTGSTNQLYANNCDIIKYPKVLFSTLYALAVPKHSPLKYDLEKAMLKMERGGLLDKWVKKWWPSRREGFCEKSLPIKQLHLSDVQGIFIVVGCGLALCIIVLITEACWQLVQ